MEEIKVLTKEAVKMTRPLWEQAFLEQKDKFINYYYNEKAQGNMAYVIGEGEEIYSMLHLSPYKLLVQGSKIVESNLITGVATRPDHRECGYMDRILKNALQDMARYEMPFVLINNSDMTFCEKYGFHYVYDRVEWRTNPDLVDPGMLEYVSQMNLHTGFWPHQYSSLRLAACHNAQMEDLAAFVNNKLAMSSDVFVRRDKEYFEDLKKQMLALDGGLFKFEDHDRLIGYFACTVEDVPCIREAVVTPELLQLDMFERETERIPATMARILYLPKMLEMIHLKPQYEDNSHIILKIEDDIIAENNGTFDICITQEGSYLTPTDREYEATVTISDLTAFLFGYAEADSCFHIVDKWRNSFMEQLNHVAVLYGIQMSELV